MSLDDLRKKIDQIDEELVKLLNARTGVALEIGKLKHKDGQGVCVPAREKEVLQRVTELSKGPLKPESLRAIFREVMAAALSLEKSLNLDRSPTEVVMPRN
jgi:chorismate mutase/prephenate dehydratase